MTLWNRQIVVLLLRSLRSALPQFNAVNLRLRFVTLGSGV